MSGLETLGILEAMQQHCALFEPMFVARARPLSMNDMLLMFSYERSERKKEFVAEGRVLAHWNMFLQAVEGITFVSVFSYTFIYGSREIMATILYPFILHMDLIRSVPEELPLTPW